MEDNGEPSGGWFLRAGMTLVGSRAMLDEGQPLCVMVAGQSAGLGLLAPDGTGCGRTATPPCSRCTWTR